VSAIRFLSLLPDECSLPTVAPDHEGGLLVAWEGIEPEVIVTLEEDTLHLNLLQARGQVLASLNHPNIASIYGLEQSGSIHYLVLELVPGETLAERIARGPIPLEEALDIATQMAEALEEAHEQGIVHRDLKPANVRQTDDGKIKVLDYGWHITGIVRSPTRAPCLRKHRDL